MKNEISLGGGSSPSGIAILGSHPATVEMAPYDDDWLIYTCSPHNYEQRELPRFDEWFEIHKPAYDRSRGYRYQEFLKNGDFPVWMRDEESMPDYKNAQLYPEKEMKEIFCPFMFTSSIAYIMAKAIIRCEDSGIRQMGLFGIMQASETEYLYQRPGIQYFIWEAERRGIEVLAPDISKLFEMPEEEF